MTIDPTIVIAALSALTAGLAAATKLIYSDLKRDRDYWRDTALGLLGVNERAIGVAEKVAKRDG
jgi:hypothetical protein